MVHRSLLALAVVVAAPASAQSDRHEIYLDASAGYVASSTNLGDEDQSTILGYHFTPDLAGTDSAGGGRR